MNEQDFVKLKTDCEIFKTKIDKLEHITERQEERIIVLEKENSTTDFQFKQIMETLDEIKNKTIPTLMAEIQSIKNKPAERYNAIITGIISACTGGIIGFIISRLFN